VDEDRIAERSLDGYNVARIIALSDGIFAIAMTLLVLDLPVPQLVHATNADLLGALADLQPGFASFVLSFALVGLNWMNHHRMFRAVARSDQRLSQLNLVLLLLVCLVPFTAALLSRYGDLATAVIFYASNLLLMGIVFTLVRLHVSRAGLLDPRRNLGPLGLRTALLGSLSSSAVFAVSIPLALWNPNVAELFWLILIPLRVVLNRLPMTRE
jgi:uncharacterized membrane protein